MSKKKKKTLTNTREIQNAAKTLLANIRFASVDHVMQSIVVTSSVPNEGKTTTTIELAKAIAGSGSTVLLVEADMRRRSAAAALGVHPAHGAYAVMTNEISLKDAVVPTGISDFYYLDIEPNIPNPADLLSSRAYARLVDEACDTYDYVLFDTPPVGTFVDAAILSRLVDGVVMVVKVGGPKRDEILGAFDQLQKAEAHVIGVCATFCEATGSEYYYAYYNKDNQRIDPKKEARKASKKSDKASTEQELPGGERTEDELKPLDMKPARMSRSNAAHTAKPTPAHRPAVPVSSSQSWKASAVQAGAQAARRSNTPRINRSKEGRRY